MMRHSLQWLLAAVWLGAAQAALATPAPKPAIVAAAAAHQKARIAAYLHAWQAYEDEAAAYWKSIADKRRLRFAKRRNNQPVELARLRADPGRRSHGPAAAARLPAATPPSDPSRQCRSRPVAEALAPRPSNTGSCRTEPRTEAEFKQQAYTGSRPRPDGRPRNVAFSRSTQRQRHPTTSQAGLASTASRKARSRSRPRSVTTDDLRHRRLHLPGRARRPVRRHRLKQKLAGAAKGA